MSPPRNDDRSFYDQCIDRLIHSIIQANAVPAFVHITQDHGVSAGPIALANVSLVGHIYFNRGLSLPIPSLDGAAKLTFLWTTISDHLGWHQKFVNTISA